MAKKVFTTIMVVGRLLGSILRRVRVQQPAPLIRPPSLVILLTMQVWQVQMSGSVSPWSPTEK